MGYTQLLKCILNRSFKVLCSAQSLPKKVLTQNHLDDGSGSFLNGAAQCALQVGDARQNERGWRTNAPLASLIHHP